MKFLALDTFTYTVTLPDSGRLTAAEAVRRMRLNPDAAGGSTSPQPDDLALMAAGGGIVTFDGANPDPSRKELSDRLAGPGFRHWHLDADIDGNTTLYARYGDIEGEARFPEPLAVPFTPWPDRLGPLMPYTDLFRSLYEDDDPVLSVAAVCLSVIEHESGVRFGRDLLENPLLFVSIDAAGEE